MSTSKLHFTYTAPDRDTLQQGDILERTDQIDALLKEVHPHYQKTDYRFFIILTQSCDLIRRERNRCKARYITIAAVRPLQTVLYREASSLLRNEIEEDLKICDVKRKAKMRSFLERLFNNNAENYFFLYREQEFGLEEDHCAFIQLSIAVRADLHYDKLLGAKRLQLTESFQHKLGYRVGNSYSRIGTEDWLPDNYSQTFFNQEINKRLNEIDTITWLDVPTHEKVVKKFKNISKKERTVEKLEEVIKEIGTTRKAKRKDMLDLIYTVFGELDVSKDVLKKGLHRLDNRPEFGSIIK